MQRPTHFHPSQLSKRIGLSVGALWLGALGSSAQLTATPQGPLHAPITPGFFPAPSVVPITGNSADFGILDSVEGTNVDLMLSSMDGMALDSNGRLFVVNPYHGTIARFTNFTQSTPDLVIETSVGPVSLATWVSPVDGHEELLSISRSTYALSVYNPGNGKLLDHLALPAEPADLLVVGDTLYVSCSADNIVQAIDLVTRQVIHSYSFDGAIAYSRLFESNGLIYVTAQHSGNNSLVQRNSTIQFAAAQTEVDPITGQLNTTAITDLNAAGVGFTQLPDEDVMCINPVTQTVSVAMTNAGTTLGAGAVHPTTGAAWILNTEANNKDATLQSEPLVNGKFISNRITISSLGGNGIPAVVAGAAPSDAFVSLDNMGLGAGIPESVGQPYDLCFASTGEAYVIGLLSDNVVRLDSAGNPTKVWRLDALTEGRIPRDLQLLEAQNLLLIYCWGTNDVAMLDLASGQVQASSLNLGYDPISELRKAGRRLFFDADNSLLNNASCASCHIEGVQDFVAWNLSNLPEDDKGPMQTQNLRGLKPLNPYHWRGERSVLKDFNVAFAGLLGGTQLGDRDFDAFKAYIFGLQEPANPRTHPSRKVVDSDPGTLLNFNVRGDITSPGLSAVNGQLVYNTIPNVGVSTCQDCHALPTGTTNDFFHDDLGDQDHRSAFDVPAYNGLWRKEQKSRTSVLVKGNAEPRPPLGVGSSHAGNFEGVYEFIVDQFGDLDELTGSNINSTRQDVALFMHQIDSGIAPSAHRSALLDLHHPAAANYAKFLRDQAEAGNSDLACIGTISMGGISRKVRWFYDVNRNVFIPDDPSVPKRRIGFFIYQANNGLGSNLFLGLPRGMGRRWAIDFDDDGLVNKDELLNGSDALVADSDGDTYLDGVEVAGGSLPNSASSIPGNDGTNPVFTRREEIYHTAKVAKFIIESDEYASLRVDYTLGGAVAPGSPILFPAAARHFNVFLRDMIPSYPTTGASSPVVATFTLTDRFGNSAVQTTTPITPLPFILTTEQILAPVITEDVVITSLDFVSRMTLPAGEKLVFSATVGHQKDLGMTAMPGEVVIARLLTRAPLATSFARSDAFTLDVNGVQMTPPDFIIDQFFSPFPLGNDFLYPGKGRFAVSTISDANGNCTISVILNDPVGTEVYLSVETAGPANGSTYLASPNAVEVGGAFHLPASAPDARTSLVGGVGVTL